MLQISIQSVPSQRLQVVLAGQNCTLSIYQKGENILFDLNSNGTNISLAVVALNAVPLTWNYSGFLGNLLFIDTQGNSDPTYDGLGSRFQLVYLTVSEYALIASQVT